MSQLRFDATCVARAVQAQFTVDAGEVLAIIGPNGAGKSTMLAMIAGLLRPDEGSIRLGEHVLSDSAAGTFVPTHRRRTALLLQDPLLFPHLTVRGNVEFGLRGRQRSRTDIADTAQRWLRAVDALELASRHPRELSGGQSQRVAIARALATEPDLILLDEPLSGLDVASAPGIRALLAQMLGRGGQSAIVVTHDLMDAVALADRVLVLEAGRVSEIGESAAVLSRPSSEFGARFAGVNLVRGTIGPDGAVLGSGLAIHGSQKVSPGSAAVAVFGPRAVSVHRTRPEGSPRNVIEVSVTELAAHGDTVVVTASAGAAIFTAHITATAAAELGLAPDMSAYFVVKAHEVLIQIAP